MVPVETITSDGSYGGYFGNATGSNGAVVTLAGNCDRNPALSPERFPWLANTSNISTWIEAAVVVVAGQGLGQVRRVVGQAGSDPRAVRVDRAFTTPLGPNSVVSLAPNVGNWIVVGNVFANGTVVQTCVTPALHHLSLVSTHPFNHHRHRRHQSHHPHAHTHTHTHTHTHNAFVALFAPFTRFHSFRRYK
jgi:hypothetical protein